MRVYANTHTTRDIRRPTVRSVLFATIDSKISNYSAKHDRSSSDGYDGEVDIDPRQAVRDLATPCAMKR